MDDLGESERQILIMINNTNEKERILWIDIYKALAIVLVVIGHATGKFNQFIYLFHMSAFFLMSEYVAKQREIGLFEILRKKVYSIIVPLFFCVVINALVMAGLNHFGYYNFWFGNYSYIGFTNIIKQFLLNGSLYCWWLGAAWFLVALFFVVVLSKILYDCACGSVRIYCVFTFFLYGLGYFIINNTNLKFPYYFDLVLIGQFFYCMGFVCKEMIGEKIAKTDEKVLVIVLMITTILMGYLGSVSGARVDYPNGEFKSIILNTIAGVNGVCWLYALSLILSRVNIKSVIWLLSKVGQDTFGILLLHFMYFKVSYLLFFCKGIIPKESVALVVPEQSIGDKYWLCIVIISLTLSVITWEAAKKIPVVSVLLGLNNQPFRRAEHKLKNSQLFMICSDKIKLLSDRTYIFRKRMAFLLCGICICIVIGYNGKNISDKYKALEITFPNHYHNVTFSGGWQAQGEENYLWIEDTGSISIKTNCHKKIMIEGYVPEEFEEVELLDVYVNDRLMGRVNVKENPYFVCEYDISKVSEW